VTTTCHLSVQQSRQEGDELGQSNVGVRGSEEFSSLVHDARRVPGEEKRSHYARRSVVTERTRQNVPDPQRVFEKQSAADGDTKFISSRHVVTISES